ncbi:MAG: fumarylacetoacetate hydrolase family protein [Propionibacteriaceae bacterium]|nr:fumarylacetoacetate hydrolase family protein [Propionibacteriaceae bacterium]
MRIARIATPTGPQAVLAEGDRWLAIDDPFADQPIPTGATWAQEDVRLLAPVEPRVVLGMLHNSGPADRALAPQAFLKSARTVVGPGAAIVVDPRRGQVMAECELALVVGRPCRNVSVADAPAFVWGWTIGNDVTAVDQTAADETRTQAKNGDGFTPLGPWVETDLAALDVALTAAVDGVEAVASSTAALAWNPFEALSHLSGHLTLGPGDVILTGAPGTAFAITPGVEATCAVAGIGVLSNPVHTLEVTP